MNVFAGVFVRLEFASPAEVAHWRGTNTTPDDLTPRQPEDELTGYIEQAVVEGDLREYPESIEAGLAMLGARAGWSVNTFDNVVELMMNGGDAEDYRLVATGIANALFFHAVERTTANGYFYVIEGVHADGGMDVDGAWLSVDGTLHSIVPSDDYDEVHDFREPFQDRLVAANDLWSVQVECESGPWSLKG